MLTARFEVELLAPVAGRELRAVGTLGRRLGKKLEASSTVWAGEQQVARGRGLFVAGPVGVDEVAAYRAARAQDEGEKAPKPRSALAFTPPPGPCAL